MNYKKLNRQGRQERQVFSPIFLAALAVLAVNSSFFLTPNLPVRPGADRLLEAPYLDWVRGKRVGLISNPTGVDSRLVLTAQRLEDHPEIELRALFGPEHGFSGHAQAGEKIESGPRVFSLYGSSVAPPPEALEDLDVLLFDIQDVGVRFYTYISTLFHSMQAAARHDLPFIVLDRPNPIDARRVEGPVLEAGFESFVGIFRLPVRYGMTAGELAQFFNREAAIGCDLNVVPVEAWSRGQWFDQTGLEWVLPSPNMPALSTATVYPGFCLIEGTNVSEGRGTTRPFELFGAPWLDARSLAGQLNALELPGVRFRPQAFTPSFSKYKDEPCQGIQVHVVNRESFEPLPAVLHVLSLLIETHPDQFEFRDSAFDRLAGNSWIRQGLRDKLPVSDLITRWQPALQDFTRKRQKYLIYPQ